MNKAYYSKHHSSLNNNFFLFRTQFALVEYSARLTNHIQACIIYDGVHNDFTNRNTVHVGRQVPTYVHSIKDYLTIILILSHCPIFTDCYYSQNPQHYSTQMTRGHDHKQVGRYSELTYYYQVFCAFTSVIEPCWRQVLQIHCFD